MFKATKHWMQARGMSRLAPQARNVLRVTWISASLLWRTYLANLILSVLLFGQQPARVPTRAAVPDRAVHLHGAGFSKDYGFHSSKR